MVTAKASMERATPRRASSMGVMLFLCWGLRLIGLVRSGDYSATVDSVKPMKAVLA